MTQSLVLFSILNDLLSIELLNKLCENWQFSSSWNPGSVAKFFFDLPFFKLNSYTTHPN